MKTWKNKHITHINQSDYPLTNLGSSKNWLIDKTVPFFPLQKRTTAFPSLQHGPPRPQASSRYSVPYAFRHGSCVRWLYGENSGRVRWRRGKKQKLWWWWEWWMYQCIYMYLWLYVKFVYVSTSIMPSKQSIWKALVVRFAKCSNTLMICVLVCGFKQTRWKTHWWISQIAFLPPSSCNKKSKSNWTPPPQLHLLQPVLPKLSSYSKKNWNFLGTWKYILVEFWDPYE